MEAIKVQNITKSYGEVKALQGIDLSVNQGEIFGLIGPDGAGKTSLIRILTTLILPDAGDAFVMDKHVVRDYNKIRKIVGYMPQRFSLYMDLSVEENLQFYAEIFGTTISDNYSLIEPIYKQIEPFKTRKAAQLSGGMKQKLALSCALIHKPEVLFLDEPTTGVDAVSRVEFWEMLHEYKKAGITVFVSTPYMDEALQCDQLAFIKNGTILSVSKPEEVLKKYPFNIFKINAEDILPLINLLKEKLPGAIITRFGTSLHCSVSKSEIEIREIIQTFSNAQITPIKPTIEDCFLWLSQENE
ncbi:MAG: ABC transporter ATP-binding protein [Bacteroidales bacterium]|jgi:ABC-type multidrug transport system ATPase subunit|nr:ABC transporter ATP-binding protein [Bacteroidales bacterium]